MKFTLVLYCDNDAFGDTNCTRDAELADTLERVAKRIRERIAGTDSILVDINGNPIGHYFMTRE